jgi:hypothetical protein
MKKQARRLALNRETILRLNDSTLRGGAVAGPVTVVTAPETQQPACYSPLCVPTYWNTCETYQTVVVVQD